MKIVGISLVRNVADIIAVTVRYHLGLGLDEIWILDNESIDGTPDILQQLTADDPRIRWRSAPGEYQQAKLITALAQEVSRDGADWIVAFDADEFWFSPCEPFRTVLERTTAGALRVPVINYIQAREQSRREASALLTMTRRAAQIIGPPDRVRALVEAREIAFVEAMYPPKTIVRAAPDLEIAAGTHSADHHPGHPITTVDVVCLHAPLYARDVLTGKVEHSARLEAAGLPSWHGWHARRFGKICGEGLADEEWAANSYAGDVLDVFGVTRPTVADLTLRNALAPFLPNAGCDKGPGAQRDGREWQAAIAQDFVTALHDDALQRTAWAGDLEGQLIHARARINELEAELTERTRRAQTLETELRAALQERTDWARAQEVELERTRSLTSELQTLVQERTGWARAADAETDRARAALASLQVEFEERTAWALQMQDELRTRADGDRLREL